jgi:NTE family protein
MANTLVLSGGGAKGDFEVGALQYLYENGYSANAICSTSVGSVNASQLAQGGDPTSQRAAFDTLKAIWQTELTFNSDMYIEAPWLARVTPRTREAVTDLYSGRIDIPSLMSEVIFFPPYLIGQVVAVGINLGDAIDGLKTAQSVFTLDPIRAKLRARLNAGALANSGVELRLVTVSLDSGKVRYVTQDGHVLETDNSPVPGDDVIACAAERAAYNDAMDMRFDAITALHESTPSDRSKALGEVKRATEAVTKARAALSRCMATAPASNQRGGLVVDVTDGVIASSSIPCVFPPVTLGNESYVDGGIRWVLPLKSALDFASDTIVAINTSLAGIPPAASPFSNANLLDIAERAVLGILMWEAQERHEEVVRLEAMQRGKHVWMITPRLDVHDSLTIDPGLIDINISYGYMIAADVLQTFPFAASRVLPIPGRGMGLGIQNVPLAQVPPPLSPAGTWVDEAANPQLAGLADAIAMCRRRCWEVEHTAFGTTPGEMPFSGRSVFGIPDPSALDDVRLLKTLIGLLVDARRLSSGRLPSDAAGWADTWERHQWVPADVPGVGNTPWGSFDSRMGTRTEANRPNILFVKTSDKPQVYLLNPTKHLVLSAAIPGPNSLGLAAVKVIPDEVRQILEAIPTGADIA